MGRVSSAHALLILASLADESRHGYAIKKDVAARTGGAARLGSTTLYRLLAQLLEDGSIEERPERPSAALDDPRRRYYRITRAGRRRLADELRRLESVLLAARGGARVKTR